jgi:hypothetical protein
LSDIFMLFTIFFMDVRFLALFDGSLRNRLVLCASVWCAELLFFVVTHFINFICTINPNNKYHVFCQLSYLIKIAKDRPQNPNALCVIFRGQIDISHSGSITF